MAQRRANLFSSEMLPGPDDSRTTGGVGALLRRRREETQQDIEEVSHQLRIRSIYVRAIEEGRFQELPGTAYAVGFVRAYADYLGLDGNSIVGDYRDELARRSRQNDLVWPTEGTESRFPGGSILVVCVLLGLAIYGGWYYATQSGGTGIKLIDQVPEYIKKATGVGQTATNKAPAGTPSAEPAKTEAQAATVTSPAAAPMQPAVQNSAQPAAPVTAGSASSAAASSSPPAASSNAQAAAPAAMVAPSPPPAVVVTPSTAASPPGSQAAASLGQGAGAAVPAAPGTATSDANPAVPESGAAAGTSASADQQAAAQSAPVPPAAKVVIRANRDSWIEIRDKDDAVVVQKVLRQGESFNVPDQKGLVMTTGNAGGVVIELEGKPLQSLGSLGVVKRNIKLDPAALADGSAFATEDN